MISGLFVPTIEVPLMTFIVFVHISEQFAINICLFLAYFDKQETKIIKIS